MIKIVPFPALTTPASLIEIAPLPHNFLLS